MTVISDNKVREAYETYCTEMGMKTETWHSIFEFSAVAGFSVIHGYMGRYEGNDFDVNDDTAKVLDWLTGPHAATMAKILKARRRSRYGRFTTPWRKAGHMIGFCGMTIHEVITMLMK